MKLRPSVLRPFPALGAFIALGSSVSAAPPTQEWAAISPGSADLAAQVGSNLAAGNASKRPMAVDAVGNTYVTGSRSNGTNNDYLTQKFNATGTLLWSASYSGPGNGEDNATGLALDSAGDVIVTGRSMGSGSNEDFATVKYSGATGAQLWVARYNHPAGNDVDRANAVAVDSSNNIVVTGYSYGGAATSGDYATVKYSPSGTELWVARYSNLGYSDNATALALDGAGNVVVTGGSNGPGFDRTDYATVKYNSSGMQQWVARYNSTTGYDNATAVAIDGAGNVVVTGDSEGSGTSTDYATVKYNPSGGQVWVTRYNAANLNEFALALALDAAGNAVVTGTSVVSGTLGDFYTIKYAAAGGAVQWAARYTNPAFNGYDSAYALTLDGAGNVFVTGSSAVTNTLTEYATVKYNPAGGEVWVARYNNAVPSGADVALAVVLDGSGDLRVAGTTLGTALDHFGVLRYNGSSGAQVWFANDVANGLGDQFGSNSYPHNKLALAVDAAGNSYVTGSRRTGSNRDYVTQKFNAAGALLWSATYNGPGNGDDTALALALDGAGDVLVTGRSFGSGTGIDYATLKYDGTTGATEWSGGAIVNGAARYNGPPGNSDDQAFALAVDGSGDVVVAGRSIGNGTGFDYATLKYDGATGAAEWSGGAIVNGAARYNGPPGNSNDIVYALALDGSNDVVVTGYSNGSGTGADFATVKYDGVTGATEWSGGAIVSGAARYNGPPGNNDDLGFALALDGSNDVVVTGYSFGNGTGADFATVKYDGLTGAPEWSGGAIVAGAARYNGPPGSSDEPYALVVDAAGDVVVTGYSVGSGTGNDFATVKYDGTTGAPEWSGGAIVNGAARYNGPPGNNTDTAFSVAMTASGDVLVTGQSVGSGTGFDYATLKYNRNTGSQSWVHRYTSSGSATDQAFAVAVAPDASLRVAGTTATTQGERFGILKLVESIEATTTTLIGINPSPSTINAAVTFTARVTGATSAPTDGQVQFTASTGETCTDASGAAASATAVDFSCDLTFTTSGARTISAAFSGSASHSDSASNGSETHLVRNNVADLSDLSLTGQSISPVFDAATLAYAAIVAAGDASVPVSATASDANASINIEAQGAQTGASTRNVALAFGANPIAVVVTAEDTVATKAYIVTAYRAAITLDAASLAQTYTGAARVATATTQPAGLAHSVSYLGIDGTVYGPSTTPPTNAGRYTVTAMLTEANYSGSTNGTLDVAKAIGAVTFGTLSFTYDGNTKAITAAITEEPATSCSVPASPVGPNAGSYPVTATCTGTNYTASGGATATIAKVNQATLTALADPSSIVFGANSALSTTGGSGTGGVTYAVTAGASFCSVTGATMTGTGVGICTVTATKAADVNFNETTANVDVTVSQATQATLTVSASPSSIAFNGTSALSTAGGSGTGAVTYAVTAGASFCDISGSTLTGMGVGTCTVTATKAADANYTAATATVDVTVVQATQATLTASASPSSIAFSGSSTLSTSGGSGTGAVSYAVTAGGTLCSVTGTTLTGTGVGTCTVTATKAADANYTAATATVDVTIVQSAQATLTASASPSSIAFNGTSVLSTTGGSGTGAVTYAVTAGGSFCDISGSTLTGIGVGTCTVTVTKAADTNYTAATATVDVIVNQATQATLIASASPASIAFGQSSTLSTSGGSGTGAVTYEVTAGASFCSIIGTTLTGSGVGSCTVTATKAADANYTAATATVDVTVVQAAQATLTASASPSSIAFNGTSALGTTGGSGTGAVSFAVTAGGTLCSVTGTTLTGTGIGTCTVTATKAADANYTAATATVDVTVIQATQAALTASASPSSIVFNGTSALSTTGGSGTGAVSFAVTAGGTFCSVTGTTLTGTGVGTCTVTVTKAADANYTAATATVDVIVVQATQATLTASASPSSIAFNGTSALSTTGGSGTGAVTYAVTAGGTFCSVTGTTLTGTGVGTCTVTATKAADVSYTAATATVDVTVVQATQATLTASASPSSIAFNGTSTLSTSGGSGTGALTFAVTAGGTFCSVTAITLTGTGVGTCTVTATKAADANYTAATATVDVEVVPAADLEISKTDNSQYSLPGSFVEYEILVANAGPLAVQGARMQDPVPVGLANALWTCAPVQGATCPSASGSGGIDELINLPVNGVLRYVFSASVTAPLNSTITNTATVAVPAGTVELDAPDNNASDVNTVVPDGLFGNGFETAPPRISVPILDG